MSSLDQIRQAWEDGKFLLLFDSDSREGEVDMVIPSEVVKPHHISTLRNDAGGLICTALSHEISDLLGLPYITDIYEMGNSQLNKMLNHGLPYGARSSFSVAINHVKSFTGITDNDRALTIRELGHMAQKFVNDELTPDVFASKFRIPGHVPLLRGREGLIANRQGHTELSLVLCALTGFAPSATMCEMMDSKSFNALSIEDARAYAEAHDYPYIDGKTVETLWRMVH